MAGFTEQRRRVLRHGASMTFQAAIAAGMLICGGAAMAADDKPADVAAAGGMKVYVDPATGRILSAPASAPAPANALALTPQEQQAFSTSSDGLVETPSPTPGGGYRLNLQGRFQNSLIATVGPDGKPQVRHITEAPSAPEPK